MRTIYSPPAFTTILAGLLMMSDVEDMRSAGKFIIGFFIIDMVAILFQMAVASTLRVRLTLFLDESKQFKSLWKFLEFKFFEINVLFPILPFFAGLTMFSFGPIWQAITTLFILLMVVFEVSRSSSEFAAARLAAIFEIEITSLSDYEFQICHFDKLEVNTTTAKSMGTDIIYDLNTSRVNFPIVMSPGKTVTIHATAVIRASRASLGIWPHHAKINYPIGVHLKVPDNEKDEQVKWSVNIKRHLYSDYRYQEIGE